MDITEPRASPRPDAPAVTPVLRTVLLCDIVESTSLVERLGDLRAVALLQKHDQMLRQAIVLCHGQLIDKADGVLALFERPIQALDFALRYQRGLATLGQAEGVPLKARIGIHVGDVMMWANPPQEVLAGAKPFEVEGLAKPVAGRLTGLALPGQILMSGMAQNLCHRAAGELGDTAARLRWLVHGRYRFKGVPAPMLVHEVGEAGLAPLRAPESGAKAWRELPLWRRPPVLALELALGALLLAAGLWTTLRAPPAIAFAERDWVVMGDLQNRSSEPLFDDTLDTAFRIGLEQSSHVNLMPQTRVDDARRRMQREGQVVDRQLGSELALREGAKALVLPTVSEAGGRLRLAVEVVDPVSGVTVYTRTADAADRNGMLDAMDKVISDVRLDLGESLASIRGHGKPLEQVTTGDIEALRAFSMGLEARQEGRSAEAMALYRQAVKRDPDFAIAWMRMGSVEMASDIDQARRYFEIAASKRDRLSDRESLLLDAAMSIYGTPEHQLQQWKLLASIYPDEYRAYYNYSYFAHFTAQRYGESASFIAPALVRQNPTRAPSYFMQGASLLALDRLDEAFAAFRQADSLGYAGYRREQADAHAVRRDYASARDVMARQVNAGMPGAILSERLPDASHALDQGRRDEALAALDTIETAIAEAPEDARLRLRLLRLSVRHYAPDAAFADDLRALVGDVGTRFDGAHAIARPQIRTWLLAAAWLAAASGDTALARDALARGRAGAIEEGYVCNADLVQIVEAELELAGGDPTAAITRLGPRARAEDTMYLLHAVLMRAQAAAGDDAAALSTAEWLSTHRGRAFAEPAGEYALQFANVIESNLALMAASTFAGRLHRDDAQALYRADFERAWPGQADAPVVRRRADELDQRSGTSRQ